MAAGFADVLDALYAAYFEADAEGMVSVMSEDVEVTFLGRSRVVGREAALAWFRENNTALVDLDFRIRRRIVDGDHAAVIWDETAVAAGRPYENHGVDVFEIVDGEIRRLQVNNDVTVRRRAFDDGG